MKIFSLFLVIIFSTSLFSQAENEGQKKLNFYDWSVMAGTSHDYIKGQSTIDFVTLAPNSGLDSIAIPTNPNFFFRALYTNPTLSLSSNIRFYNKKKEAYNKNFNVRVGLNYSAINTLGGRIHTKGEMALDTFVSAQSGDVCYLDSIWTNSYFMKYNAQVLRLDVSCLLRLKPQKRWSAYIGAGISTGISVFTQSVIEHFDFRESVLRLGDQTGYAIGLFEKEIIKIRNKNPLNFFCYVPVGIDFRIGEKSDFWKRAHLFYELKFGRNFFSIPELGNRSANNFQQGLGFRLTI